MLFFFTPRFVGFRFPNRVLAGCGLLGFRRICEASGLWFRVEGSFRVQGLGFGGFRVQGFRVLGFRVYGLGV